MDEGSRISGFYKLGVEGRVKKIAELAKLTNQEVETLKTGLSVEQCDRMIENVVGRVNMPVGIATNFRINGKDYLIPMATEEPSVVAAASNAAKIVRESGGFTSESTEPEMIGQIQVMAENAGKAKDAILMNREKIIELANKKDPTLVSLGGGVKDLEVRVIDSPLGKMVIVHLFVNVQDAMGANAVNTMAEAVAPFIEDITGGKVFLRILSNLALRRMASASCVIKKEAIGEDVVNGVVIAYAFAAADIFRAATHNKGAMNGITAVALATGNDTRAVEAGAHAYASVSGRYSPITKWTKDLDGNLHGEIKLPLAVGTFGGATNNPVAQVMRKILGVTKAKELSEVMAAVGLAQNFAALKALSTEGIQRGHMELHAKNVAVMAGAKEGEIAKIADVLVKEKNVRVDRAKELLSALRGR
jgi:hydroxymethylglutaryl-CoA reductase